MCLSLQREKNMIWKKSRIKVILKEDLLFPQKLKEIDDCPDMLFIMGNEKILNDKSIAIVGSRKCSEYGKEMAYRFSNEISKNGIKVVIDNGGTLEKTLAFVQKEIEKIRK